MQTVVGIDLGTQSLKVLFYNPSSKTIEASASSPIELKQLADGTAEQDALWWLSALENAFEQIPVHIKKTATAIAVSGQQHGFVPVDIDGKVLSSVKLWCDTSTSKECEEITQQFGGVDRCINELGNPILEGYTASKILWFKKHSPTLFEKLHQVMLPHDYLNFHLSGVVAMEPGDASGTGLLNIRTRNWNDDIINIIDDSGKLKSALPELKPSHSRLGTLSNKAAQKYQLPENIPIAMGGGDNMMGAIGTGNVTEGIITMSLGSSGTVYTFCEQAIIDKQARLAAFCSSTQGWLPLLCTMNCTLSTEIIRGLLKHDLTQLEDAVSSSQPGASGVLTLPFYNGERTPNLPHAKASILGLDSTNTSTNNLLRSAMEGATFGLRFGIEALKENNVLIKEIRLTGGGSHSTSWRQMIADICQTSTVLLTPDEGAAFGAALQAMAVTKQTSPTTIQSIVSEHVHIDESSRCTPNTENATLYNSVYKNYLRAVKTITPFY